MEDCKCLWNTKKNSDHCRNKTARDNVLKGKAQELNFPEFTVEEIQFKIKAINTRYGAELVKVI
jgi:Alcohol dehydrogenase transcription factor Myb/SANT-like.